MDALNHTKNNQVGLMNLRLQRFTDYIKEPDFNAEDTLRELEAACIALNATFDDIMQLSDPDDIHAIHVELDAITRKTDAMRRKLLALRPPDEQRSTASQSAAATSAHSYEKQRLMMPKFSGEYREWAQFSALFKKGMLRYPELDSSDRLQFLVDSLQSEKSRKLISCFASQVDAFERAWESLEREYDRPFDNMTRIMLELLNSPKATTRPQLKDLGQLALDTKHQLELLKLPVEGHDHWWNSIIINKMDAEFYSQWRSKIDQKIVPTTKSLLDFLREQGEIVTGPSTSGHSASNQPSKSGPSQQQKSASKQCPDKTCKLEHPLAKCPSFLKASYEERWQLVRKFNVCSNCLITGHQPNACQSKYNCRECNKRHHTILHKKSKPANTVASSTAASERLLATAIVAILAYNGKKHKLRAFIDPGSHLSFITERSKAKLGLQGNPNHTPFSTLNGTGSSSNETINCELHSCTNSFKVPASLHVVTHLTMQLPPSPVDTAKIKKMLEGKTLADPGFHKPADIDLLLGSDLFSKLIENEVASDGEVTGLKTKFGWVFIGDLPAKTSAKRNLVASATVSADFHKFWQVEEVPQRHLLTPEEAAVEKFSNSTTTRLQDGKFCVKMPLKEDLPRLGASRHLAIARLQGLERKFSKDPAFAATYKEVMADYIAQGHLETASLNETRRVYYVPHHAVLRPGATTTKLRVVFDASARSSNGRSLNDCQMNGPRFQDDLFTLLTRFRSHPIALTADIAKMYRQVWLHPDDRDLQRIVWRNSPDEQIQDLRLTTVTFGEKAAPYMAIKALQMLSDTCPDPAAAVAIRKDFYVDDLLTGAATAADAARLLHEIRAHLLSAGFPMHKWASNVPAALADVADADRAIVVHINDDDTVKTLGIQWNTASDTFSIVVTEPAEQKWTRRSILSVANGLYDPLGWLAPFTVSAKMQLQQIIKDTSDWDMPLPRQQTTDWEGWVKQLPYLHTIALPRCIKPQSSSITLCGFCDASEKAYAACVYARTTTPKGQNVTRLIAAKTKVAPLRPVSLPRLELLGAHLLAKLMTSVANALQIAPANMRAWTDSTITLSWILPDDTEQVE